MFASWSLDVDVRNRRIFGFPQFVVGDLGVGVTNLFSVGNSLSLVAPAGFDL